MTDFQLGAADQRIARDALTPLPKTTESILYIPHKIGNTDFYEVETATTGFLIAEEMKHRGHALSWVARYDEEGKFERASVMHYRTCFCNQPSSLMTGGPQEVKENVKT